MESGRGLSLALSAALETLRAPAWREQVAEQAAQVSHQLTAHVSQLSQHVAHHVTPQLEAAVGVARRALERATSAWTADTARSLEAQRRCYEEIQQCGSRVTKL